MNSDKCVNCGKLCKIECPVKPIYKKEGTFCDSLCEKEFIKNHFEIDRLKTRVDLLDKLLSQISVYSGKRNSGLVVLQDLIYKLENNKNIICEVCGNNTKSHKENCEIVTEYIKLLT